MDELLDRAPCGFLSFADDGRITIVNRTLLEMLRHDDDVLTGQSIERIFTAGTRIFYQTHFFPLIRMHGRADEIFLMLRDAGGSDVGVLANAVRRTRDGVAVNDCVFVRVIERQKYEQELLEARRAADRARAEVESQRDQLTSANEQLEQQAVELEASSEELFAMNLALTERTAELERARETADEANRAKTEFLAMMSHELRTPLNAIGGYAQLLAMGVQGPVTDKQRDSLDRIEQSQRHLLNLINELLNLARVESGHVEYDITEFAVADVVDEMLPLVMPQMQERDISLDVSIGRTLRVRADRPKVLQILLNLLSNAIKFTPARGTITIATSATQASVHLDVADTGVGIPADMLTTIFDPFVQVHRHRQRNPHGTGLGLAISRDLARGMDGDLSATSVEGSGSTFRLTLARA